MQLISVEHPAYNAEEFILFRVFSSVSPDSNTRDIWGSAADLLSWYSELNKCIIIELCLFIDFFKTDLTYISFPDLFL